MQVSVETLKGLERKITISVPSEKIEEEVGLRLRDLARKVKMDGFRQGKAPFKTVQARFKDTVRGEVARDMIQSTLYEALKEQALNPAGSPHVEPLQLDSGKDFIYSATFEVFPEITLKEFEQEEIELTASEVEEKDIDILLKKMQEQSKDWHPVDRPSQNQDKLFIDFEGFINGEAFEGGKAANFEIILGSGSMIPGFEEQLINHTVDENFEIQVTFPETYGHQALAGKEATFKIKINKILEGVLPELNEDFVRKYIKEGDLTALKEDIRNNMSRELEQRINRLNREKIFNKYLEHNPLDIPLALVDREIEHLKHEMYHRIFGNKHSDNEKIPDFPRELFENEAKRRVHLSLLFSEYVKKHELQASKDQVNAMIDKMASAYESPDELRSWYNESKERLAEVEALVLEELVAQKIAANAKITYQKKDYDEVMNPKKPTEQQGEAA